MNGTFIGLSGVLIRKSHWALMGKRLYAIKKLIVLQAIGLLRMNKT